MSPRHLAPGTMLSGRYQLAEVLGESDLSTVYAAQDVRGPAQIALKVFDASVMSRVAALSEYQNLARQASGLGVEGIARAYDFGIDANTGAAFSTAERISWASLDRRVLSQGPLGPSDLSRALSVMARAIDAAHAARLLHRDLKPQNVFISPDNPEWVRITDFGVSAVRRGAPEALGWGGPPGYTPPDAVDSAAPGTPGADLFALGVIAFFALTRATPFRSLRSPSFDPSAHWAELNQPLYPISERAKEVGVALDPAFDAWFGRALTLSPQERFRNAGEMARELSAITETVSARGGGGPRSMPGIAAAIAQPLLFQPEPSPASLGLPHTAVGAANAASASAPSPTLLSDAGSSAAAPASLASPASSRQKRSALPLLIGAGVLLFAGLAYGGYALFASSAPEDAAKAAPEPSAAPAVAVAAPALPAEPAPAASVAAAANVAGGAARASFKCQPETCEWVVCDGKNLTGFSAELEVTPGVHECSASKFGFGSKSLAFTATPGQLSEVVFDLPPLPAKAAAAAAPVAKAAPVAAATPAAKAVAPAAKPAVATTAKPAAVAAKPAASAKAAAAAKTTAPVAKAAASSTAKTSKKKCSTFLGCK